MVSRTSRRTLRGLRPSSHSRFGSHLNLIAEKIAPFFSSTYVEPILQPFCFQIHACNGGCTPLLNVRTFKSASIRRVSGLSPFSSNSCALFCTFLHATKTQPFFFKRFRTLCRKPPGWGVPPHKRTK